MFVKGRSLEKQSCAFDATYRVACTVLVTIVVSQAFRGEMREAVTRGKVASYVAYIFYKYSLFSPFPSCFERHFAVE